MAIDSLLNDASAAMTVISLVTFVGILWWAFSARRKRDFEIAAQLPFADDDSPQEQVSPAPTEPHHG